ncbi:histidine kinase [Saccharopolyspora sp. 6M]|uniref:sensor histidine kinase n=1 Tax=Saccharopolyspora sp. 6M TaxID=2877237 RepID=UPI001CD26171|nr:histidine kinase [Saccharopolyspora sp. 6M]MCA1224653.1 histidine kinase [Saccharopolyspora sp. 6M]
MATRSNPVTAVPPRTRWWVEAALLVAVSLLSAQEAYVRAGGVVLSPQVGAVLLAGIALAWRGRNLAVAAVPAVLVAAVLGTVLALLVVLYSCAKRGRLVVAAVCAVAAMGGNLLQPQHSLWGTRVAVLVLLLVAVATLRMWAGGHRRLVASLAAQVDQLRVERELRAEQARLTERGRVAAELHDSLAHSLSVLALHTGALQRHSDELPPQVADRIDLLRATSTEALRDLRDVLAGLRSPDGGGVPEPRRMRDLEALFAEARAAGQPVAAEVSGDAAELPFSHRLAIYRLVQEALTNARKHAPGSAVRVRVRHGPPESTVDVENDVGAPVERDSPSGYGLVGLAERVDALHGTLEHGPSGTGGWRLSARIPAPAHSSGAA